MTWIQLALAIPAAFFAWTLVRDFRAGLSEERLWGDPEDDEPIRVRNEQDKIAATRSTKFSVL